MIAILSTIGTFLATMFSKYTEYKKTQADAEIAREEARRDLAKQMIISENERGKIQIKATGRWFKYITFFLWAGPFLSVYIFPFSGYGPQVFQNMQLLPDWYVQSMMTLMFAIWGIAVGRDTIANIFANLGQFMQARREYKLRKFYFDVLRKTKGHVTGDDVRVADQIMDEMGVDRD